MPKYNSQATLVTEKPKKDYRKERDYANEKDIQMYLNDIAEFPILTHSEEVELGRRIRHGDQEAREKMVQCNLKLVVSIAKAFRDRGFTLMELVAEGNIGLIRAIEKYDPERGNKFSTYATWWIKQYIRRVLPKWPIVHIPSYLIDIVSKIRKTKKDYIKNNGYEPMLEELLPDEEPSKIHRVSVALKLLERTGAPETKPAYEIADPDDRTTDDAYKKVQSILKLCSEREQLIMKLRSEGYTLEKVGKMIGLTRERIRQIETKTVNYIRKVFELPQKKAIHHLQRPKENQEEAEEQSKEDEED